MKLIFTTLLCFSVLASFGQKPKCDCNDYPVKPACKGPCGMTIVKTKDARTIAENLGVNIDLADKVAHVANRQNKRSIDDFKNDLSQKDFAELRKKYISWVNNATSFTNNGIIGNNNKSNSDANHNNAVTTDESHNNTIDNSHENSNTRDANNNYGTIENGSNSHNSTTTSGTGNIQIQGSNNTIVLQEPKNKIESKTDVGGYYTKSNNSGLNFEVTGCRGNQSSQSVTVYFTITNSDKVHQYVQIGNNNHVHGGAAKAYDPDGNLLIFKGATLGPQSGPYPSVELPTGLPVRGSITYGNVLPSTSSIFMMNLDFENKNWDGGGNYVKEVMEIHNVKIEW